MLFQDWPHDVLDFSLALAQEIFGGSHNRSIVTVDFDLGGTIRFHRPSAGSLGLGPGHLNGGDFQRQDISPFDHGENECATAFHNPEANEPAVEQLDFPSGDNEHLVRTNLDETAGPDADEHD